MDKEKFRQHLDEATRRLIDFTGTLCYNEFSDNYRYILTPNTRTVSADDKHLNEYEISVLAIWNSKKGVLLSADEVIVLLHHDNTVPVWIDASVYEARSGLTVIDLFCSRRLRGEAELMHQGLPPFHLQVAMPPDNLREEVDGRFDVNWRKQRDDQNIGLSW